MRRCGQSSSICSTFHTFWVESRQSRAHHAEIDDGACFDAARKPMTDAAERERPQMKSRRPERRASARPIPIQSEFETKMTWSSRSIDSKLSTSGGCQCCSRITAADSVSGNARSRRHDAPKLRSVSPPVSVLWQCVQPALTAWGLATGNRRSFESAQLRRFGRAAGSGRGGEVGNEFGRRP